MTFRAKSRPAETPVAPSFHKSHQNWNVRHSYSPENSAVALDFGGRPHGFGVVVGQFYGRATFDLVDFANKAERVEPGAAVDVDGGTEASLETEQPCISSLRSSKPTALRQSPKR